MAGNYGQGVEPQKPQAAAGPSDTPLIKDTTTATFGPDVIAQSARQPVLVDFWAPWCEPCKQLTPVLEKVVKSAGGKVKLVKMNIDEHPQIPGRLGVRSIPAVIAFNRSQPVDGFMGALPESQIRGFIERLVGPLEGGDDLVAEAEALLAEGDAVGAAEIFAAALKEDPTHLPAVAGLARAFLAAGQPESAKKILASVPASGERDTAILAAKAAVELAEQAASVGEFSELTAKIAADPADYQARFDYAIALNAQGNREEAANALLDIVKRDRNWNEDGARKQLLQFFEAWGPMDPATIAARKRLSSLLFA
ncbi:MAG TPA: co-chaperone YbbN [Beijerinckia sp.]|jgi:putative thioredoxin|nr:co-chaperone YbbN [Beijerinckia sp.]